LDISREIGDRCSEGIHLGHLGNAYAALGENKRARDLWRQALTSFEAIESPYAATVRAWLAQANEPSIGS
jgi:hypothetical protein